MRHVGRLVPPGARSRRPYRPDTASITTAGSRRRPRPRLVDPPRQPLARRVECRSDRVLRGRSDLRVSIVRLRLPRARWPRTSSSRGLRADNRYSSRRAAGGSRGIVSVARLPQSLTDSTSIRPCIVLRRPANWRVRALQSRAPGPWSRTSITRLWPSQSHAMRIRLNTGWSPKARTIVRIIARAACATSPGNGRPSAGGLT